MNRSSAEEIRGLLLDLLCERIYPRYPQLVRNDAKTARIVHAYLAEIEAYYQKNLRENPSKIDEEQGEAIALAIIYSALVGLGVEALRKHIWGLWSSGQLPARLRFDVVK